MVNGTPSGMERHRRTVRSSVVEMLLLSKSSTPIGMPTTIDPYCSWVGASRSILKRWYLVLFIPDLNAGRETLGCATFSESLTPTPVYHSLPFNALGAS